MKQKLLHNNLKSNFVNEKMSREAVGSSGAWKKLNFTLDTAFINILLKTLKRL